MLQNLLTPLIGPIINRAFDLIPNSNARAKAKEQLESDLLTMVKDADENQAKINMVEAAHTNLFVAGWRPGIGWTCGIAIFYAYVGQPFLAWILLATGNDLPPLPVIETDRLFQLVLGMLGMGGLRTFEKIKGVARNQ